MSVFDLNCKIHDSQESGVGPIFIRWGQCNHTVTIKINLGFFSLFSYIFEKMHDYKNQKL